MAVVVDHLGRVRRTSQWGADGTLTPGVAPRRGARAAAVVAVAALLATSLLVVSTPPRVAAEERPPDPALGVPDEDQAPSPLEALRPAIRTDLRELDTFAAALADLRSQRTQLVELAAQRRADLDELGATRRNAAQARVERATVSVERARQRHETTLEQRQRLTTQAQRVAMGLYLEGEPLLAEGLLPGRNPLSAVVAHELVRAGVKAATDAYRTVQSRLTILEASLDRRMTAMARAEAALAVIDAEAADLASAITDADAAVADLDAREPLLVLAVLAAQERVVALLEQGGSPAHRAVDPSLTILGPSRLSADQLASWLTTPSGGRVEPGRAAELASAYVEEGAAVGVRGDVAAAQAVLETAGFRFTGTNNFAGIGHCDSCPRGFAYPTLREGVRAQMQLLRAYADAELDPETLPGGPVSGLGLSGLWVKGCCVSWWGLTGVWATALHYGGSILRLYESALDHAASLPSAPS